MNNELSINFEAESEMLSPLAKLSLPKDKDLPPIIREIVTNAPASRKIPAFIASLSPLCALCPRVRLHYYYDSRPSALLLQVLIEGPQSSGKSYAADIEDLIMRDTLKALDKEQRRLEQEYREKKKRRKANEKLEEEPKTTIRVVPATISKTVLTKRADFYERILGDTMTFWMFAEELAQVTDAGKQGYSNLRTIMRTAYDLGSLFGMDFASDNSYSAIVDINICSMFCTTPAALDDYYDKKAIEGGNITRCILCRLDDDLGADGAIFTPYSDEQKSRIAEMLQRLMDRTYEANGQLKPTIDLDMSWLEPTVKRFIRQKGEESTLSGSVAIDVFRKRSSVSAFRVASLCYYLYSLAPERERVPEGRVRGLAKQIYQYMAEYILASMLNRWGKRFEELNANREKENRVGPQVKLYDLLSETFTREQLSKEIDKLGRCTPEKVFLSRWKKMKKIEIIDKNTFRKI